jgi:hypothetical protein
MDPRRLLIEVFTNRPKGHPIVESWKVMKIEVRLEFTVEEIYHKVRSRWKDRWKLEWTNEEE